MPTLTIFANFRIDSDERFQRMVDSFHSIANIGASEWVVNARGLHAEKTLSFLREQIGDKLVTFSLESPQGWFNDTRQMLHSITGDYVLFWLEDHLNIAPTEVYGDLLQEMHAGGADYLEYSWWHSGKLLKPYKAIPKTEGARCSIFTLTKRDFNEIEKDYNIFIISMAGVFSNSLFKKIINKTSLFLRPYPKQTPFNFEKGGGCKSWLPIRMALPKQELFANIDDDHSDPGYSLQSRGLYPTRERRHQPEPPPLKSRKMGSVKKMIPTLIYKRLIKVVIFYNRVTNYLRIIRSGG